MAYDANRAKARETLVAQIASLEKEFGANSPTPALLEARITLWALEYADNPTQENLARLQRVAIAPGSTQPSTQEQEADVPAVKVNPTATGSTTVDSTTDTLKVIGWAGDEHLFREDTICDENPASARWDNVNNKVTLHGAQNSFEDFYLAVESAQAVEETFTVALSAFTGPGGATISNTSTDPANKRDRPIKLRRPAWAKSRGVSWFSADYSLTGSPLGPGYWENHRYGPWRSSDGSRLASSRPALGKSLPTMWMDTAWLEVGQQQTAPANGVELTHCEVWLPVGLPAGLYTAQATITAQSSGQTKTIDVELNYSGVVLHDENPDPYYVYVNSDALSDRVNGKVAHDAMTVGSDAMNKRDTTADLVCQMLRSCRLVPALHDNESGTGTVTVPDAKLEARVMGSLYDGEGYLGPAGNQQLPGMFLGVYARWQSIYPGVDPTTPGDTPPAALTSLLDAYDTWRANVGFTGDVIPYIRDEPKSIEQLVDIERWSKWFTRPGYLPFTTPGSSNAVTANFEDMIATCPSIRMFMVNAPIMPKDTPTHLTTFRAQGGDRKFGLYNNQSPMAYSHQVDDRLDGHVINGLAQQKLGGFDVNLFWSACDTINNEGSGHLTGYSNTGDSYFDADGELVYKLVAGRGRPNFYKTHHTFGEAREPDNRSATHGECGHLYCEGDGNLLFCGTDFYFDADAPGVNDVFPSTRLLMIRRRRQYEQLAVQAKSRQPAATQTLLDTLIPDGAFAYELGVHADGTPSEDRSYHNTDRLLDNISSLDVGAAYQSLLTLAA